MGTIAAVLATILVVVGYAVWQVASLGLGIQRSDILSGREKGEDLNILLMGLDSRLDMRGQPLAPEIYEALHAGDATDGGLNANVLMFVHVPADGSRAVAFSIPRDDYVDLAGCPLNECKGKIKSAYGLAFEQENQRLAAAGINGEDRHLKARDAARKAQITTVENFLDVKVDHFVEVTMVAFFEIAQVVQPVTVCVKEDTVDTYSGADFKAGEQQIDAVQAVAFVRQRRDTSNPNLAFTDMDRSRRQQAFIVSLLTQLKQSATLTNPVKVSGIVDVAKRNTAIDTGLDPITLARTASAMQGGNLHFYTLPVERFDSVDGHDVNIVDLPTIRAMVKDLLAPPPEAAADADGSDSDASTPAVAPLDGRGMQLDVLNASGVPGAAKAVEDGLVKQGFRAGEVGNAPSQATSTITHGAGAAEVARGLGERLGGLDVSADPSLPANTIRVTLGTGFTAPEGLAPAATASPSPSAGGSDGGAAPAPAATAPVDATGGGASGPPPTALTELGGEGVPCVK